MLCFAQMRNKDLLGFVLVCFYLFCFVFSNFRFNSKINSMAMETTARLKATWARSAWYVCPLGLFLKLTFGNFFEILTFRCCGSKTVSLD